MQQLGDGVLSIDVLRPVGDVIARQENLGDFLVKVAEEVLPD